MCRSSIQATADRQHLGRRSTYATTDRRHLGRRGTHATAAIRHRGRRITHAATDHCHLGRRSAHVTADRRHLGRHSTHATAASRHHLGASDTQATAIRSNARVAEIYHERLGRAITLFTARHHVRINTPDDYIRDHPVRSAERPDLQTMGRGKESLNTSTSVIWWRPLAFTTTFHFASLRVTVGISPATTRRIDFDLPLRRSHS